jgi:hypothetical protein
MDVDHFRPKKRIEECKDHSGYWWLAFDCFNFRLSCSYCNRAHTPKNDIKRGKHDHFPLAKNSDWCKEEEDRDTFDNEMFLLLDPTVRKDPDLLWFLPGGLIEARNQDRDSLEYQRAKISIEIYYLDAPELIDARGKHHYYIKSLLKDIDGYIKAMDDAQSEDDKASLRKSIADNLEHLYNSVQVNAEYSAVAIETIRSTGQKWVRELVQV